MKKNIFLRITTLAVVICLAIATLASCSISDLFGKDTQSTTAPSLNSTTGETTTAAPAETTMAELPKPDLVPLDMSKYLTVEYKGLELTVEKLPTPITDEEVESELRSMLVYYNKYSLITDRVTAEGDYLEIEFVGTMNGEKFEGGSSDKSTVLLDKENSGYIPGFADVLFGVNCGESVTANLTFPKDYHQNLAGKDVTFEIKVHGICDIQLTDEIANELSKGEQKTAEEYRAHMKEYLDLNQKYATLEEVSSQIWDTLIKNAQVTEMIDSLYQFYYVEHVNSLVEYANYYGISYEEYLDMIKYDEEDIADVARENAIVDMAIYYIAACEGISVSEEDYQDYLDYLVEYYKGQGMNYTAEEVEKNLNEYYGDGYLYTQLLSEDVIFAVFDNAVLVEKPAETE